MYPLPPAANPLDRRFRLPLAAADLLRCEAVCQACKSFDKALKQLESRYPSHRPVLTVELRNKKLKHRPK